MESATGNVIPSGKTDSYSLLIKPKDGLLTGTYTGELTITYETLGGDGTADSQTMELEKGLSFTVNQRQLTITQPKLTTKRVYNTTTKAEVTAGTLENVVSGDTITVTATASYDNADAGEGKTITVTYAISGTNSEHYIAPEDYTVTTGEIEKAYMNMEIPWN